MKDLRPVAEWRSALADPAGPALRRLTDIYGLDRAGFRARLELWNAALDGFAREYSARARVLIARATGRVNLLGMHIDHRGGAVNALAAGDTLLVAAPRADDLVVLRNLDPQYPPRRFRIRQELPAGKIDDWDGWTLARYQERLAAGTHTDWSNYVRAAVLHLQHLHTAPDGRFAPALKGMDALVAGNLRAAAGLSSSSAVVVAAAEACARLNGLEISDPDMVEVCRVAEWYVGTRGGGGDHAAIKFGRRGHLTHIGSFPLRVELIPFPADCCAVLCDSLVVAAKTAGARDAFNQRVACYELGMLLLRQRFPEHAARMAHLRDVNPAALGVDEGAIYQMLKALPEAAGRPELAAALAGRPADLERVWRTHRPAEGGYRVRGVCLYGIAECLRSERAVELLRAGDAAGFGEMITISHHGDRVTRRGAGGGREPLAKPLPDAELDRLTAEARGSRPDRRERARLWRQPGGYDASCPELDELTDIVLDVPGVLGAGLVGAGLGGCIVALARRERAGAVLAAAEEHYYRPRGLPADARVCPGIDGSGVFPAG